MNAVEMKIDKSKYLWESMEIKPEYQEVDIEPLVKFSSLTAGGALTKAALTAVKSIADACLTQQNKIERRHTMLENLCLKADIKPPLTHMHMGTVFYADDAEFLAKANELIGVEINRKAEIEANLRKKIETDNQQKLNEALAEQQEAAIEIARKEIPESSAKEESKPIGFVGTGSMSARPTATQSIQQQNIQSADPLPETRTVLVTMVFAWDGVTKNSSNQSVENFLRRRLPEPMQARLHSVSSENA